VNIGRKSWIVALCIEILGLSTLGVGIGVELATGAHIGYVIMSGGAFFLAGGGLYYAKIVRGGQ